MFSVYACPMLIVWRVAKCPGQMAGIYKQRFGKLYYSV